MNFIKNLLIIGMGGVCPYLKTICLVAVISLTGFSQVSAQIDVTIVIVMGLSSYAPEGEVIEISPNPFYDEVDIAYDDDETNLNELVIKNGSGEILYTLDLTSASSFSVQLSAGNYYFLVETDTEIISKSVVLSEN